MGILSSFISGKLYNYLVNKRVLIILGIIIVILAATNFILDIKKPRNENKIISPLGKSFSIDSVVKKHENPKYLTYGYLPYWSLGQAKYFQYDKLTDISYFGLYINSNGSFRTLTEDGEPNPGYDTWKNDKNLNEIINKAKIYGTRFSLTVISHEDEASDKFLFCKICWDTLTDNLFIELESKKIKDVNLNFEYVELTDGKTADKYTEFVSYINNKLKQKFGEDQKLVVSTFADSLVKERVTKIPDIAFAADSIFIMGYDFHRPDSDKAGPVSPINGKGVHAEYDIETMLNDYLSYLPPNKLILGVPYYGYNWVVKEEKPYAERIPGSDEIGFSQPQTYSAIMDTILEVKPAIKWDDLGKVPYFTYKSPSTKSNREVYYENVESLKIKYELIKSKKLLGVGIWALGYDGGYIELWNLLSEYFNNGNK
ncbi:hypothetical protein A3F07_02840 [candidate division WWE3 bacterium RIFCSPHIGHO2_12_FULL_38_15]|uniref:GH18 domain-containing protein n=1 Tax=candidate division WWE3 bacterium RIFCSPHIGHO2_02_FULL_38_14 TaxID=1802620 RepID=A0A1F4VA06_UNCKA|nr:MAG: hypothetical protein A3F07_02840 [candidate division WWE3 bacterium RIFCSPHIGHO2_12_FULL_38_15]OGC53951.1 MAG: hypothetical protein A3B64_02945 [candidate division WWE3 bacterium RIFCSPLOWO2_01_FULL_37_24]OGC54027.1 MAG: hypothetical protein A3D91_04680 [candidate division WWE3 bacterium RIFCSPHIGHO2_02_FULL_38_14]